MHVFAGVVLMKENDIIIVDKNVSLKPYLKAAKERTSLETQLEHMGFEIREEKPVRKIGFLAAAKR